MNKSMTNPHIHSESSTQRLMLDVIIALVPALVAATFIFGLQALILTAVTITAAVFFEVLTRVIMKKDISSVIDLSAVITGFLIALSLPANTSIRVAIACAGVAIVIFKQLFGGIGCNLLNPALAGRFIVAGATGLRWSSEVVYSGVDAIGAATPLRLLAYDAPVPSMGELFLGIHPGCLGETSIIALLIGAAYLLWRRVISPVIPLTFIGTTLLIVTIAGQNPMIHLLSGSLVLAAVFMATDYTTSPINTRGRIIFGVGCGIITAIIRIGFGDRFMEGITYAILIMNLLTPFIDKITLAKGFSEKNRVY